MTNLAKKDNKVTNCYDLWSVIECYAEGFNFFDRMTKYSLFISERDAEAKPKLMRWL